MTPATAALAAVARSTVVAARSDAATEPAASVVAR